MTVEAHALPRSVERSTTTDAQGQFTLGELEPGRYQVAFRLPSFAAAVQTIEIASGATASTDVTLRIALNADVLVTGQHTFRSLTDLDEPVNGLLGLAEAGSAGVVTAQQIEERPVFRSGVPELVSGVQYQKGTYSAEEGDFSAAGAINVNYLNVLDHRIAKIEGGEDRFGRALFAASSSLGGGHLLYAGEAYHSDGPWERPDGYRKWNGILRYSRGDQQDGFSLTAMAYSARWNSTDQVPQRAIESGLIGRFGNLDPSDAGNTHRYTLAGEWRKSTGAGLTLVKAYTIDYGLDLFSNFTFFLADPEHGDQFEQKDERAIAGVSLSQRFLGHWFGKDTESVAGFQGRFDHVPTLGLYHTQARQRLETIRQDRVDQGSGALFFQSTVQWTPIVRSVAGLRSDAYHFDVRSDDPANSGTRSAALLSPKLSLVLGPWSNTEVYANWGWGFHSNDARGAVQRRDPKTGEAVDPIVRARGAELGVRTLATRHFHSTGAAWLLDIASELVFVGDAGTTEASRRVGFEWSNVYTPVAWLTVDADLAYSWARFRDQDPSGDRIPGAIEGVASAGVTVQGQGPVSGSLRLRHFGPRPLIEDASVRSKASTTLNARLAYRMSARYTLAVDAFNLTNSRVSDIDYYYTSRLRGEPTEGVDDIHTHPLQPFTVRASISDSF